MKKATRALATSVVLVGIAGISLRSHWSHGEAGRKGQEKGTDSAVPSHACQKRGRAEAGCSHIQAIGEMMRDNEATAKVLDAPQTMLEAIAKEEPWLADFHVLRSKALRTQAEEVRLAESVGAQAHLDRAAQLLTQRSDTLGRGEQYKRMLAVDFLVAGIGAVGNGSSGQITQAVYDVLLDNGALVTGNDSRWKSVAGDRVEIFIALNSVDPTAAQRLWRLAQGQPSGDVLTIAQRRIAYASGREVQPDERT